MRQVIVLPQQQAQTPFMDIAKSYLTGRQLKNTEQENQLSNLLSQAKISEFNRVNNLASQYESGQRKAPEGFVYNPLTRDLEKNTPNFFEQLAQNQASMMNQISGMQGGQANIPKTQALAVPPDAQEEDVFDDSETGKSYIVKNGKLVPLGG